MLMPMIFLLPPMSMGNSTFMKDFFQSHEEDDCTYNDQRDYSKIILFTFVSLRYDMYESISD